jgi:hypothetical protein
MGPWEILIGLALLMPPAAILVNVLTSTDRGLRLDEIMCLLSGPLTIYHIFALARFINKLPEIGVIPGHVIVIGAYCLICLAILIRSCIVTKPTRWSQTLARWFGILFFGFFTAIYSVGWMVPPL